MSKKQTNAYSPKGIKKVTSIGNSIRSKTKRKKASSNKSKYRGQGK